MNNRSSSDEITVPNKSFHVR